MTNAEIVRARRFEFVRRQSRRRRTSEREYEEYTKPLPDLCVRRTPG